MTSYSYPTIIGAPDDRSRNPTHGRGLTILFVQSLPIALKMHGPVLRTNPITINDPDCVPPYYWGAGRPGSVSDPGSDLPAVWISP